MKNNLFNIRYNPKNNWLGQRYPVNGFCSFANIDYSIRAAYTILRNYIRKGFNTLQDIINRWAPPIENPTFAYIAFVNKLVKKNNPYFNINQVLSPDDHELIVDILYAMMLFENHKQSKDVTRSYIYKTLYSFDWK